MTNLHVLLGEKTRNDLTNTTIGALKGLASSMPIVGVLVTPIIEAWEGYQSGRLEDFCRELGRIIGGMEVTKIDKNYLESEEFYDLLQKCFKVRMQHRSKLKAKFIMNLINETISTDRNPSFTTDMKEMFLNMLEDMSDSEQIFLSEFAMGVYAGKSLNDIYQGKDDFRAIAVDVLYAKGILRDADTWKKEISTSVLGREFIAYIKILATEDQAGSV